MISTIAALAAFATVPAAPADAETLRGEYLEARTADIYTGPCFSNAEMYIKGREAVAAWKIRSGSWNGVDLSGLKVVAVLVGDSTFMFDDPAACRSVVVVDEAADSDQRDALVAFARHMAKGRLENIAEIRSSRLTMTVEAEHDDPAHADRSPVRNQPDHAGHGAMPQAPPAMLWAPRLVEVAVRPLDHGDHFCGNEEVSYEPLSRGVSVAPGYLLEHAFKSKALGVTWSDPNCRGAFVGQFTLADAD